MKRVCLEMDTLKKATGKDNNVHLTDCIYVTQGEKNLIMTILLHFCPLGSFFVTCNLMSTGPD